MLYDIGLMPLVEAGYRAKELIVELNKIVVGLNAFLYCRYLASHNNHVLPGYIAVASFSDDRAKPTKPEESSCRISTIWAHLLACCFTENVDYGTTEQVGQD